MLFLISNVTNFFFKVKSFHCKEPVLQTDIFFFCLKLQTKLLTMHWQNISFIILQLHISLVELDSQLRTSVGENATNSCNLWRDLNYGQTYFVQSYDYCRHALIIFVAQKGTDCCEADGMNAVQVSSIHRINLNHLRFGKLYSA